MKSFIYQPPLDCLGIESEIRTVCATPLSLAQSMPAMLDSEDHAQKCVTKVRNKRDNFSHFLYIIIYFKFFLQLKIFSLFLYTVCY